MIRKVQIVLLLIFFIACISCKHSYDCDEANQAIRSKSAQIVVVDNSSYGRVIQLKGYDPVTKKEFTFHDQQGFYETLLKQLSIGDTLIKSEGSLLFVLKKKTSNVNIIYGCDKEPKVSQTQK